MAPADSLAAQGHGRVGDLAGKTSRARRWCIQQEMIWRDRRAVHNFDHTGTQIIRPDLEAPGAVGEATRSEVADLIKATKLREFKTLGIAPVACCPRRR